MKKIVAIKKMLAGEPGAAITWTETMVLDESSTIKDLLDFGLSERQSITISLAQEPKQESTEPPF